MIINIMLFFSFLEKEIFLIVEFRLKASQDVTLGFRTLKPLNRVWRPIML